MSAAAARNRKPAKSAKKPGPAPAVWSAERKGRKVAASPPPVRVEVRTLDPLRKCGEGTSVQSLYRVDERVEGRTTTHLVFLDRHGWYCEHGRDCPAVAHARRHDGQHARGS